MLLIPSCHIIKMKKTSKQFAQFIFKSTARILNLSGAFLACKLNFHVLPVQTQLRGSTHTISCRHLGCVEYPLKVEVCAHQITQLSLSCDFHKKIGFAILRLYKLWMILNTMSISQPSICAKYITDSYLLALIV